MSAEILASTKDMDRSTWLEIRKQGIGGSDVSAIAGLSKWKSPIAVYLEKIGEFKQDENQSEAAYWGTVLEDVVAKEFSTQTGLKIQRKNAILKHPEYPWMLANVDRLIVGQKAGLECKTANEYLKSEWEDDKIPDAYLLQCQHYMAVTGYEEWWIAVLIGGNKFRHKLIKRDEDIINHLIKIESDFWQLVENRTPPDVDGSESSSEVLSLLYPDAVQDTEIYLPEEAEELILAYDKALAEEKEVALRKDDAANKLKALLEDNEVGVIGKRKVSWKSVTSNRLDSKLLKAEKPDIYQQYCKPSSSRRFAIK